MTPEELETLASLLNAYADHVTDRALIVRARMIRRRILDELVPPETASDTCGVCGIHRDYHSGQLHRYRTRRQDP